MLSFSETSNMSNVFIGSQVMRAFKQKDDKAVAELMLRYQPGWSFKEFSG